MRDFSARLATAEEIANWDKHVLANPGGGNVLQSASFAEVKSHHGWNPVYLAFTGPDYVTYTLAIEKKVPALGSLWYLIKGPDVAAPEDVPLVVNALARFIKETRRKVFAIKVEPDIVDSEEVQALFTGAGFIKTFNLQPNDSTALLDTTPDEEQLLKNLSSRGRNAVRRAIREGADVRRVEPTEENMRTMYRLMAHIEDRSAARLRSYEYYHRFWSNFVAAGQGRFYFAFEDGEPTVGAFVIAYGNKGTYKDGGSKPRRSQYGDSHLVQWTAITELKKECGIVQYDFCGTPPSNQLKDKSHPHHGLGLFKTSFSKTVTDFVGCYDFIVDPIRYRIWNTIGERVARQIYWRRHQQPFY
ncbi:MULTISPECIES: peptidoglycan bridge formation glycyltransferase FemA/FemB family protein [unclassified Arthrobacter]|uniref:lipid II:glycine glycyltransferase FemX n=1 Tax=unclassified Arthrobacter TaxID=235627 RepID=UPI001D15008D|nr:MULTISPECIES: peptidoglycan bridge formation glycyltransferase FemA/FemB family protein [unclassified Arthrobacter]MCC3291636.1 peptidoglycan bridge formation glycyltransferase FemA/FemB family protein [Arthrobacter sp. zg-Y1110]MCC3302012.1 peptidoglycan bridge formation glycyltransferase FemA/FemB family protein [Arthrobacter sp. zg-Y895]UWX85482.1 peptidoglycan bridge formation glycyltransferase FemA/FemB family protein [Arthrobacter sp. zg-Y1110]